MQDDSRRSNKDRSAAMRQALINAGRHLFTEKGFAATGTPDIVAAAGVTRGALYHHFADKEALFAATVRAEAEAVAKAVRSAELPADPLQALKAGGQVWLDAMQAPGRARLLLVDGPAVLGRAAMDALDAETGGQTLAEGLAALRPDESVRELAALLSAAFDRAALAIVAGEKPEPWLHALEGLIDNLSAAA
ncbi:TetR/AcrR family transcriptional regulator [Neogemmobacter tilapiae]|uniref:TetR family transcriptional regulator n=1 Tax=Neogemmobacter tilapiae TaxID=875041 RepID=A0A918TVB0_9RHOB|nr:TetR/AcrR family transcriptional regulator [Gemmobacter tilapiae]GHC64153.1 TetR family transcriptional regulator [Gemmobacter tilapiae]